MLIAVAQAAEAATQAQGIAALGIDGWAIVFQLINFGILFWVLQRFAFRPLLKVLKDRQEKIAESLRAASEASRAKSNAEKQQRALLAKAREDAERIVQQAKDHSKGILTEAQEKALAQAQRIKDAAHQEIERDIITAQAELRDQATRLVVQATERLIGEKLNEVQDQKLIIKALDAVL